MSPLSTPCPSFSSIEINQGTIMMSGNIWLDHFFLSQVKDESCRRCAYCQGDRTVPKSDSAQFYTSFSISSAFRCVDLRSTGKQRLLNSTPKVLSACLLQKPGYDVDTNDIQPGIFRGSIYAHFIATLIQGMSGSPV